MARPQRRARRFDSRRRRKVSILTKEKIDYVDYKDVTLLRRFISDRAKIRPRRVTGNNEQQQRAVALAIKNAREMALLPYENRITTQRRSSDRRGYEPEDATESSAAGTEAGSESVKAGEARPGGAGGIPAPPRMPQTAAQDKEPEAAELEAAELEATETENDGLAAEGSESQSEESPSEEQQ